jgi:Diguanylate cyclase, GGDEF domain
VHVANLARECKRTSDVLARIGGEEFAMLLPKTDLDHAQVVAERLRCEVAKCPLGEVAHSATIEDPTSRQNGRRRPDRQNRRSAPRPIPPEARRHRGWGMLSKIWWLASRASKSLISWRPRPELNWCTRFCRPLRNHSATWPLGGELLYGPSGIGNRGPPPGKPATQARLRRR